MPSLDKRLMPLLACLAALSAAPAARAEVLEDTVATVDGQPVMLTEYRKNLESVMENYRRTAPMVLADKDTVAQIRRKVLDQMVDDSLLEAEARRRSIKVHEREIDGGVAEVKERNFRVDPDGRKLTDDEIDKALAEELKKDGLSESQFRERIRKQLAIRRVMDEAVRAKVRAPGQAEVREAFEKVKLIVKGDTAAVQGMPEGDSQAFLGLGQRVRELTAARVRVSHLLVAIPPKASLIEKTVALKKARELKSRLDAGEDFAELAKKNSEDRESAGRGGDLGFILKGWMPPEFEKAAFSMPVGDVGDPVETQLGYHLIRVQEKKAAESASYDKLKEEIGRFLADLAFQKELDKFTQGLRAQAHIEIKLPKDKWEGRLGARPFNRRETKSI